MIRRGREIHWPGMMLEELPDSYRGLLPDDAEVVFTHSDLHPSNIMIDPDQPFKLVALD